MAKLNIRPVGDRILIQYVEEKEQVRDGVIIPESARERPQRAKVLALGLGGKDGAGAVRPFEVKVGDMVLVGQFAGAEVKLDAQKFTLIREDDILGILT